MKHAAPVLGLLLLPALAFGDTAYEALRTMSAGKDASVLNKVVEVRGEEGVPQPRTWTILLDDPASRGGVREIEVSNGQVTSERTPIIKSSGYVGGPMNLQKLMLDSKGAFQVAEQIARDAKVSFDSLDYTLRRGEGDAPVWLIDLRDRTRRKVGSLSIAADTGKVIASSFAKGETLVEEVEEKGENFAYKIKDKGEDVALKIKDKGEDVGHKIKDTAKGVGRKLDKGLRKVGGTLESFFTGKRTIDRKNDE